MGGDKGRRGTVKEGRMGGGKANNGVVSSGGAPTPAGTISVHQT